MIQRKHKILQITKTKFPPEIRVAKEVLSLVEAGYEVAVLCPPYGDQSEYELWNGVQIFRSRLLGLRTILDKIFEQTFFFSPIWHSVIRKIIATYQPDVLHVHDIWLGRVCFAARTSQKLVFDLHENMPAAVVECREMHSTWMYIGSILFHSHSRILAYERKMLLASNMVLTVVEEGKNRILNEHPRLTAEKVINVENLESKNFISNTKKGKAAFSKDHFSILYIGGFGPHRGLDTLIRAMVPIRKSAKNIKLQLIGAVPGRFLDRLKELIYLLNVEDCVRITGWVNFDDVLANIQQADLCCVPHHSNPHTDTTIPHKLYQYMIAKRPLLVSSSAPLARTVNRAGAGLVFNAGDHNDCAKKILELADNPLACSSYAENGYRYVLEKRHNWEEESAPRLINAYDALLGNILDD